MRISKGPMLEKYARMIGEEIDVIIEWVNNYVNLPGVLPMQESTEKERLDSIKCYILWSLENSTTERIKADIERKRLKAA